MKNLILTVTAMVMFNITYGQITTPPSGSNQKSITTQYIGALAKVTITYNSPKVTAPNGQSREGAIWGQLVPFGLNDLGFGLRNPSPWRVGANENTTIEFSHDMVFQGKPISSGKYGFHLIVNETGPWTIILSNNSTAWGSFFYKESEDALRVEATPVENEFHEWLTFEFTDRQSNKTTCALMWENIKLPFTIEIPEIENLYLAQIGRELETSPGFSWQSWAQAANYAVTINKNLDEALIWAENSISAPFVGTPNFTTYSAKANVLTALGRLGEAQEIMDLAIKHPTANAGQIHTYGRTLIGQGKKAEALEVFKYNYKKYDGSWPTEVGMMRGYSAVGEYKKALEHAKIAHEQAPDALNKNALANSIEQLKLKKDIN